MEQERQDDPTSVEHAERAPDEGLVYDPAMTDEDEANIPPESEADPEAGPEETTAEG